MKRNNPVEIIRKRRFDDGDWRAPIRPLRSRWIGDNVIGKPLTDARIAKYERDGWYSAEFKEARKARAEKKRVRSGQFEIENGRMIYSPQ